MLHSCSRAKPYPAVAAAQLSSIARANSYPIIADMTQRRNLKLPIPVTIITGSLGVGKTTTLCSLLQRKPPTEVWCVIVNEFGAVGIDAVAIEASCAEGSAVVKQIAGGCMCCVQSGPLTAAIAQIIRQAKPDRVIIEPSGLGHPGGLIDVLQGPHLCTSLQLNAVICLIDLSVFDPTALMANETASAQVTVADVLVGSKADAAAAGAITAFQQWAAEELFPTKQEVITMQQGQLDSCWLDAPRGAAAVQVVMKSNSQSSRARQQKHGATAAAPTPPQQQQQQPVTGTAAAVTAVAGNAQPGHPLRVPGLGLQVGPHRSCGWVFDQEDMFDHELLLQLLQELQPHVARVKGVFRVAQKQWVMPGHAAVRQDQQQQQQGIASIQDDQISKQQPLQLQPICYSGPSMVEVILTAEAAVPAAPSTDGSMVIDPATTQFHLQSALLGLIASRTQRNQPGSNSGSSNNNLLNLDKGPAAASSNYAAQLDNQSMVSGRDQNLQEIWDLLEKALVGCVQQ